MVGIEIEAEGLEVVNELIETARAVLDAAGNLVTGCGLHVKARVGDDADNVTIANELIGRSRDFFSVNDWEAGEIAQMFAKVMQSQLDIIAKKQARAAAKGLNGAEKASALMKAMDKGPSIDAQKASAIAAKAYKEAMAKWMQIVSGRIDAQRTVYGGSPTALSPEYAAQKQRDRGFTTPIGVATGQLREQFDPSNVGNIRMYRDKSTMDKLTAGLKGFM